MFNACYIEYDFVSGDSVSNEILICINICPKKPPKYYIKYLVSADTVAILFSHIQYNIKTFEYLIRNRK